jgi:hypothetical protein
MAKPKPIRHRFEVFGPFPLRTDEDFDHGASLQEFWNARESGLSTAVGVYVWTYKEGSRRIPWNVGITSRQGFKVRFGQKGFGLLKFLLTKPEAEIEVYLLARRTKTGRFSTTKQTRLNEWLETMLIGSAIQINPELRNKSKSTYLRTTIVDGYLGKSEDISDAARSFGQVFSIRSEKRK